MNRKSLIIVAALLLLSSITFISFGIRNNWQIKSDSVTLHEESKVVNPEEPKPEKQEIVVANNPTGTFKTGKKRDDVTESLADTSEKKNDAQLSELDVFKRKIKGKWVLYDMSFEEIVEENWSDEAKGKLKAMGETIRADFERTKSDTTVYDIINGNLTMNNQGRTGGKTSKFPYLVHENRLYDWSPYGAPKSEDEKLAIIRNPETKVIDYFFYGDNKMDCTYRTPVYKLKISWLKVSELTR